MDLIGKPTINPFIFYSGKICGYITWIVYFLALNNIAIITIHNVPILIFLSYIVTCIATILIVISMINLGKSTRLGLPTNETTFKKHGIYAISRNPMYLGFNLLTISSIMYTGNIVITVMGIYSIVVYHFIILGEERFLLERFKEEYSEYKNNVNRYL